MTYDELPQRIRRLVRVDADSQCWEWTGHLFAGYGRHTHQGRKRYIHRSVYELAIGPIPEGLSIDHLCRNKACCNPAHLEAVTWGENARRAVAHHQAIEGLAKAWLGN